MKIPTGIILMGGQSSRMGTDKSRMIVNDQFLYQLAAHKLLSFCHQIILSVNEEQAAQFDYEFPLIIDKYQRQGPVGGILSCYDAGHHHILILATDLINIDSSDIEKLINTDLHERQGCTLYYNEKDEHYEPLLSIWNTTKLSQLKLYFEEGGRSLQKFLTSNSVKKIPILNTNSFKNFNYSIDFQ